MPSGFLEEDCGATLYCDDCGQQVRTNESHDCDGKPPTYAWEPTAADLVLHATSIVARLDIALLDPHGSPMCSAIREPLRHAVIEMRRQPED